MCEILKKKPKLMIADEDIIVYKRVSNIKKRIKLFGITIRPSTCISSIAIFKYVFNKEYETILDDFEPVYFFEDYYSSKRGFYSYKKQYVLANVKCIIPKGSKYYLIEKHHAESVYISNKIKIVEKL